MKKTFIICGLLIISTLSFAQILEPITWTILGQEKNDSIFEIVFNAKIEKGWHLYATELSKGGPQPTRFHFDELISANLLGEIVTTGIAEKSFDENFQMNLEWYEQEVSFTQLLNIGNDFSIKGYVEFMGCNNSNCLPPSRIDFSFGEAQENSLQVAALNTISPISNISEDLWEPVIDELRSFDSHTSTTTSDSLLWIFIKGFLGGFIALLTPCVWPIIPMTVSFFLKKSKSKRKGSKLY